MRKRDPSIHALKIAPKTFEYIHTLRVSNCNRTNKDCKGCQDPRAAWSIVWVHECECEPCREDNLDNNAKREILAGNVRKEKTLGDQKRNKRQEEYPSDHNPP